MKPQEKAKQIFNAFEKYGKTQYARGCSLIHIDLILNTTELADKKFRYYLEVRQEILKL